MSSRVIQVVEGSEMTSTLDAVGLAPAAGGQQLPRDTPPSVTISPLPGGIVAGTPVAVGVAADEGTHWFRHQNGEPDSEPIVTFTGTTLTLEDGTVIGSASTGGGDVIVTFPRPGRHRVTASCTTDTGGEIDSPSVAVRVLAAGPPRRDRPIFLHEQWSCVSWSR